MQAVWQYINTELVRMPDGMVSGNSYWLEYFYSKNHDKLRMTCASQISFDIGHLITKSALHVYIPAKAPVAIIIAYRFQK